MTSNKRTKKNHQNGWSGITFDTQHEHHTEKSVEGGGETRRENHLPHIHSNTTQTQTDRHTADTHAYLMVVGVGVLVELVGGRKREGKRHSPHTAHMQGDGQKRVPST